MDQHFLKYIAGITCFLHRSKKTIRGITKFYRGKVSEKATLVKKETPSGLVHDACERMQNPKEETLAKKNKEYINAPLQEKPVPAGVRHSKTRAWRRHP